MSDLDNIAVVDRNVSGFVRYVESKIEAFRDESDRERSIDVEVTRDGVEIDVVISDSRNENPTREDWKLVSRAFNSSVEALQGYCRVIDRLLVSPVLFGSDSVNLVIVPNPPNRV